ncbi:MAG: acetylserotonin O-methyltransferase [Candidatus Dormibacteraeota bacterium]|nr:acetylserotonin O-methyltransferase [Candidatus Dormibacteraeota bacterium]
MDSPEDQVFRLIIGYRAARLVALAAELGIADQLADGPKTAAALAETVGVHTGSLERCLHGLCALGVFTQDEEGRFGLTPLSSCLMSGQWAHAQARMALEEGYSSWAELAHTVRTGKPAYELVHGLPRWQHLATMPDASERFNAAMAASARLDGQALLKSCEFSGVSSVVDVGGGRGALMAAILTAHPDMYGTILDLASGLEGAAAELDAAGVANRCRLVTGSFFDNVPAGGDRYILRWVLHDWDDERALQVLRVCAQAMPSHARLFVIERLMPERFKPTAADLRLVMADLHMMVILGGRERTEAEFRHLLHAAGLRLTRRAPLAMGTWVLEASQS